MLKIHLFFPLELVLKKKKSSTWSNKNIFLLHLLFIIFSLQRLIYQSIKKKNWLWTKPKRKKKIQSVLWCSVNIRVWHPRGSCQTVQNQRSEFQSRPSHSWGNSLGPLTTEACHSTCRPRDDPEGKKGDPWRHMKMIVQSPFLNNLWPTHLAKQTPSSLKTSCRKTTPRVGTKVWNTGTIFSEEILIYLYNSFQGTRNITILPWTLPKCKTHRNVKLFIKLL